MKPSYAELEAEVERLKRGQGTLVAEEYRALAENSPDIVDRFDRKFHHLYDNPTGLRYLGLTADQVIGKTIRQTGVPEPYSSQWEERIGRVFSTAQPSVVEDAFPIPGGIGIFESRCVPEFAADGAVRSVLVVSRDITERRRIQDALRQSEETFAKVFRCSPNLMAVSTIKEGRVLDVNEGLLRALGYRREEFVGKTTPELGLYPDPTQRQAMVRMLRKDGHVRDLDVTVRTRAGGLLYGIYSGEIIEIEGRKVLLSMLADVTERKRAEGALRKAHAELQEKVKERTAKLRALTMKLIGAEEAERKRIVAILHEDLQQMLVAMRYELHRLKKICAQAGKPGAADAVNGILDKAIAVTRSLSAGLRPPGLHDLSLGEALAWVVGDMKKRFGLTVRVTIAPDAELPSAEACGFIVDSVRELLFNVVKHSGVTTAKVRVRLVGQRIKVEVKDRGKGGPESPKSAVGLGLFKIRERADHMGGEFRIDSSPRKGTRATLVLPKT